MAFHKSLQKTALDTKIFRIVEYLAAAQREDGDFRILRFFLSEVGSYTTPTEFQGWHDRGRCPYAVACILLHLHHIDLPGVAEIKRRGCEFLARGLENGVLRYLLAPCERTIDFPPDVDDTCLAAIPLSKNAYPVSINVDMVLDNTNRHGDFYTWLIPRWKHLRHPRNLLWLVRDYRKNLRSMRRSLPPDQLAAARRDYRTRTEPAIAANVLLSLGRTGRTRKPLARLLARVLDGDIPLEYYKNVMVLYFHLARLYDAGFVEVEMCRETIIDHIRRTQTESGLVEQELFTAMAALSLMYFRDWENSLLLKALACLASHPMHQEGWRPVHYCNDTAEVFLDGGPELTAALFLDALYRYRLHTYGPVFEKAAPKGDIPTFAAPG